MKKSPDLVTRVIADTTVLVSLSRSADGFFAYHLDEVSAFLWHALDTAGTEQELAARLSSEYAVDSAAAARDVAAFLADLKSEGLLS